MAELIRVEVSPEVVRARLVRALPVVGSVWFPTLAELRAWPAATRPLYLRLLGPDRIEVGPRLYTMAAARWAPVWRGRLVPDGAGGTRIEGQVRPNGVAAWLLGGWAIVLLAWLTVELTRGGDPRWLPWWLALSALTAVAAGLGHVQGGRSLAAALPTLERVVADPGVGDDDWG